MDKLLTNELIEEAIAKANKEPSMDNSVEVLNAILNTMIQEGTLIIPIEDPKNVADGFVFRTLELEDESQVLVAFTNNKEVSKGNKTMTATYYIEDFLDELMNNDQVIGFIINPWSDSFYIPKEWVDLIFEGVNNELEEE